MDKFQKLFLKLYFQFRSAMHNINAEWKIHANRRTTIVIISLLFLSWFSYFNFLAAPLSFPSGKLVTVEEGLPLSSLAKTLENQGVIRSPFVLEVAVRLMGSDKSVRAGDYLFKEPHNVLFIARALSQGAFGLEPIRIRIREGAMVRDMAEIYAKELQRFNKEEFLEEATPLEGYLFPDTYFFLPNASADTVIQTMYNNFQLQYESVAGEVEAFGRPIHEVITMASLLEREAEVYQDRRMIAGVLWKRIEIDMMLQVDAAFLYFLGRTTFDLTRTDLKTDSPYNTYKYKGLPPGPIGSPSLAAIRAAVNPVKHDYLYYLADNNYVTHYSKTYAEHLRKKAIYLGS
jgi:UPF0755 protein